MTEVDRAKLADAASRHLYRILSAIDSGELAATATMRARIEGAVGVLPATAARRRRLGSVGVEEPQFQGIEDAV